MAQFCVGGNSPSQWQAQVCIHGYPSQSKTFSTCAAAERWGKLTEVEMTQGTFVSCTEAESTTLRELLERYIAKVSPTKRGATSLFANSKLAFRRGL